MFHQGDAIVVMKTLPSNSINLIYSNPPFNSTKHKWDTAVDWAAFFQEADRLLKPGGTVVLHCSIPFNYVLIQARAPNYSWYWDKGHTTNPFIAKYQPLRKVEEILVWYSGKPTYYPQRVGDEERTFTSDGCTGYYGNTVKQKKQTVKGKYQTHLINMKRRIDGFSTRPTELIQLIYDSYSVEGDTVLDPFCNDGLSSTCCPGRNWVGIDLNHQPKYLGS